ncbi:6908_t:CDS:2, partial [Funneliformis caledonium]
MTKLNTSDVVAILNQEVLNRTAKRTEPRSVEDDDVTICPEKEPEYVEDDVTNVLILEIFIMQSLAAFMLTLLRRYEKSNSEMWMSIGLLMIRAGFHLGYSYLMIPPHKLSENPTSLYDGMKSESGFYFSNLTLIDIIIDGYVMYRLMQILKNNPKIGYSYPKDMFTLVMYWNLLTVVTAFLYHL